MVELEHITTGSCFHQLIGMWVCMLCLCGFPPSVLWSSVCVNVCYHYGNMPNVHIDSCSVHMRKKASPFPAHEGQKYQMIIILNAFTLHIYWKCFIYLFSFYCITVTIYNQICFNLSLLLTLCISWALVMCNYAMFGFITETNHTSWTQFTSQEITNRMGFSLSGRHVLTNGMSGCLKWASLPVCKSYDQIEVVWSWCVLWKLHKHTKHRDTVFSGNSSAEYVRNDVRWLVCGE